MLFFYRPDIFIIFMNMNLLRYSNTIQQKIHENSDRYIDSLMKKIQGRLSDIRIPSEVAGDTIFFKRNVQSYNRANSFETLRSGQIRITKINTDHIEISWHADLDALLFLSIFTGFWLGLIVGLLAPTTALVILSMILIGGFLSVVGYLIGLHSILTRMNKILMA